MKNSGICEITVHSAEGEVLHESGPIKNLIMNRQMESSITASVSTVYLISAGGNPVPNKSVLPGTYSQSGNVITRESGNFDFNTLTQGDNFKFATGERAFIHTVNNASQVTVDRVQTVATTNVTHYISGLTLQNAVSAFGESHKGTINLSQSPPVQTSDGKLERTSQGTSAQINTGFTLEVLAFVGFARIVLDTPIQVAPGNTVTVRYRYTRSISNATQTQLTSSPIAGWPLKIQCLSLVADGSKVTVTTDKPHYFETGDSIEVSGVIPKQKIVNSITSDGTNWAVNAISHGFVAGDDVTIQSGSSSYNGDFIVSSVADSDNFQIVNSATHPADTGTVRFVTPTVYFNGVFQVGANVGENVVELVSNIAAGSPVGESGLISSEDGSCQLNLFGFWDSTLYAASSIFSQVMLIDTEQIVAPFPVFGENFNINNFTSDILSTSYDNVSPRSETSYFESHEATTTVSVGNEKRRVKQILWRMDNNNGKFVLLTFNHIQSKPNTENLMLGIRARHEQDLN